jgi:hypothetical protein
MKKLLTLLFLIVAANVVSAQDYILKNFIDHFSITKGSQGIGIYGNDIKDSQGNYFLKANSLFDTTNIVHIRGTETITGAKTFTEILNVNSSLGTSVRGFTNSNYNNNTWGANISLRRARGTPTAPLSTQSNDFLGNMEFYGYDGTNFQLSARITSLQSASPSPGIVPGTINLFVANATGALDNAFVVNGITKKVQSIYLPISASCVVRLVDLNLGALGDMTYGNGTSGLPARLSGNITTAKKFLTQTGTGSVSAAPVWSTLVAGDLPSGIPNANLANSSVTFNGVNVALGGSGTIAFPLTGVAGGDLTGAYPNPTVAQFNGQLPSYYLDYNNLANKPAITSDATIVHLNGAETLTGQKTFNQAVYLNGGVSGQPALITAGAVDILTGGSLNTPSVATNSITTSDLLVGGVPRIGFTTSAAVGVAYQDSNTGTSATYNWMTGVAGGSPSSVFFLRHNTTYAFKATEDGTLTDGSGNRFLTTADFPGGNSSLTSLGTVTSGTWNATPIADNYITSAANWNAAYTNRITSVTSTGNSGPATLSGNILNIPNYSATTGTGPAGATTQIQFNKSGAFGGSQYLTWNDSTRNLGVTGGLTFNNQSGTQTIYSRGGGLVFNLNGNLNYWNNDGSFQPTSINTGSVSAGNIYGTNLGTAQRIVYGNNTWFLGFGQGGGAGPTDFTFQNATGNAATLFSGSGNLAVGTSADVSSALLHLSSTSKGFLPPAMTTVQKNAIASPAEGLSVYDVTLHAINYYNGTKWTAFSGDSASTPTHPGGLTTQIQFNNAGTFAGSAGLTWDDTGKALTTTGLITANQGFYAPTGYGITADYGAFAQNGTGNVLYGQNTSATGDGVFAGGGSTKASTHSALNVQSYSGAQIAKFFSDEIDFSTPIYATNYNITSAGTDILINGGHIPQSTFAPASGGNNYIQNQTDVGQAASFWISGDIYANSGSFAGNYNGNALVAQNTNTAGQGAYIGGGSTKATNSGYSPALWISNYANVDIAKFYSDEIDFLQPVNLKNYTVGTLPAGVRGDTAYVTDALSPSYLATIVGGGSVVTPVFYNGTNWVAH